MFENVLRARAPKAFLLISYLHPVWAVGAYARMGLTNEYHLYFVLPHRIGNGQKNFDR